MPDITMCPSKTCSARKECYRNPESGTKPSEYRQSWFIESPCKSDDPVICDYYWPRNPSGLDSSSPFAPRYTIVKETL